MFGWRIFPIIVFPEIIFRGDTERVGERTEEYRKRFANPFIAARRGYIDDVIMPHGTRRKVGRANGLLSTCSRALPSTQDGLMSFVAPL